MGLLAVPLCVTAFFLTMAGKVSSLSVQKRNPKRVNVYLDGEFAFGLTAVEAAGLRVGQWLDDAEIAQLQATDERQIAYQRAVHFLSYRPRSEHEVRKNLEEKEFSEDAIDDAVRRLEEIGLLDDAAFVQYWLEQREEFRPRGGLMLRHELRQKGVSDTLISAGLETIDEEDLAYRAAHRRAEQLSGVDSATFRRKLSAFLSRRGFAYSTVRETVTTLKTELEIENGLGDEPRR